MNSHRFEQCSKPVQNAVQYVDDYIRQGHGEESEGTQGDNNPYNLWMGEMLYLAHKFEFDYIDEVYERVQSPEFWDRDWLTEQGYGAYYAIKLADEAGLIDDSVRSKIVDVLKYNQMANGRFISGQIDHTGQLWALLAIEPDSDRVTMGIEYLLNNWQNWVEPDYYVKSLAVGILCLTEYDYFKYEDEIEQMAEALADLQDEQGFVQATGTFRYQLTAYSIIAWCRVFGSDCEYVQDARDWLVSEQLDGGNWDDPGRESNVAIAALALMMAGGGQSVSKSQYEWERELQRQKSTTNQPNLLLTSPVMSSHEQSLLEELERLISNAEHSIRLSTLRIDLLYQDVIQKAVNSDEISIQVITRSKQGDTGSRKRVKKHAKDELVKAEGVEVRYTKLLHSRFLTVDDSEAIVSSADLTQDQMKDQFNAGAHSRNPEFVSELNEFFDVMWENSEHLGLH